MIFLINADFIEIFYLNIKKKETIANVDIIDF